MAFSVVKGGVVTKADLDWLAFYANAKLTPQDMSRTWDQTRDGSDGYTPGVMTGAFSFSALGAAAERWAWLDEINRIWRCLWNISPAAGNADNEWDIYDDTVTTSPDYTSGIAKTRIEDYWSAMTETGYSGNKIVASPGPHCWITTQYNARQVKVFSRCRAIYTKEQPDFDIRSGVMIHEIGVSGDMSAHDSTDMVRHTFLYTTLGGADLWGYFEAEFTRTSGGATPTLSDILVNLGSSGGGATGGVATMALDGDKLYIYFDDGLPRNSPFTIVGGSIYGSGDQWIEFYCNTPGWVWSKSTWRGGFVKTTTPSTDGTTAGDKVIHPRNESVRAALHVGVDPHLIDSDFLDFDAMDALLSDPTIDPYPAGQRPVDIFIRNALSIETIVALDEYPATVPTTATCRPLLLADLNDRFIDADRLIYTLPAWAGVTLRPATIWMMNRDTDDPEIRKRANRLLLEDAYPGIHGLNRIPPDKVAPENEILDLTLADPSGMATFEGVPLLCGHMTSLETAKIIYLADALPQWAYYTFCDLWLPNGSLAINGGATGPKGPIRYPYTEGQPGNAPVPSNWPVFHVKHFGLPVGSLRQIPDPHTLGYAPFWDSDKDHRWYGFKPISVPAGAFELQFVAVNLDPSWRYEVSGHNRKFTLYASMSPPNPSDPTTYMRAFPKGHFVYPDDFVGLGDLVPGNGLWVAFLNTDTIAQSYRFEVSVFRSHTGEFPPVPIPDPKFFPVQEPNYPYGADSFLSDASVRFSPVEGAGFNSNRAFPVPQRGYMIRDVLIQRVPKRNASGITTMPANAEARTVRIGIMAGAGVIAGAVNSSYPGEFIEFDAVLVGAGVVEMRVDAMWPVLDGMPLAYYAEGGDDSEEFCIFASVEFQPAINNTFVRTTPFDPIEGAYNGMPFLSATWGWSQNNTNPNSTSGPSDLWGKHRGGKWDVMPPISARAVTELYGFLATLIN